MGRGRLTSHATQRLVDRPRNLAGRHGLASPLRKAAEYAELILALVDQPPILVEKGREVLGHDVEQRDAVAIGLAHGRRRIERSGSGRAQQAGGFAGHARHADSHVTRALLVADEDVTNAVLAHEAAVEVLGVVARYPKDEVDPLGKQALHNSVGSGHHGHAAPPGAIGARRMVTGDGLRWNFAAKSRGLGLGRSRHGGGTAASLALRREAESVPRHRSRTRRHRRAAGSTSLRGRLARGRQRRPRAAPPQPAP